MDLDLTRSASLFAGDTATWRRDGKVQGSDREMTQAEVDKILDWATKWKMKVNGSKTKAIYIDIRQRPEMEPHSESWRQ